MTRGSCQSTWEFGVLVSTAVHARGEGQRLWGRVTKIWLAIGAQPDGLQRTGAADQLLRMRDNFVPFKLLGRRGRRAGAIYTLIATAANAGARARGTCRAQRRTAA
jgi:hypothetical protein